MKVGFRRKPKLVSGEQVAKAINGQAEQAKAVAGPRSHRTLVIIVFAVILLLASGAIYWFVVKEPEAGSSEYITNVLNQEKTKEELDAGNCSDETVQKLGTVNESGEPTVVAKAYEAKASCLVYANKPAEAAEAFAKAANFYQKAGNAEMAATMQNLSESNKSSFPIGPVEGMPTEQDLSEATEGLDGVLR